MQRVGADQAVNIETITSSAHLLALRTFIEPRCEQPDRYDKDDRE
jgi:hypothetical protein